MLFGKKNCCGNCLQSTLDRESQSNQPRQNCATETQSQCGKPEASKPVQLFGAKSASKQGQLFANARGRN